MTVRQRLRQTLLLIGGKIIHTSQTTAVSISFKWQLEAEVVIRGPELLVLPWPESEPETASLNYKLHLRYVRSQQLQLLSGNHIVSFSQCYAQLYCFSVVATAEDILLFFMAYDRYVAICHPLHYHRILRRRNCILITIGIWAAAFLNALLFVTLALKMSSCHSNVIHQYFCDIKSLTKTTCTISAISDIFWISANPIRYRYFWLSEVVSTAEDILLFFMAYDRYVAICRPLHYHQILRRRNCTLITIGIWAAAFLNALLLVTLALKMSSCNSNVIHQYFCDIKSLTKTTCTSSAPRTPGVCNAVMCMTVRQTLLPISGKIIATGEIAMVPML
ncbi:unnamed protein product [Ranitomeya imitator]|uniref:G-protein coupled receptors family 1 profile domain-containing protein n=1 Tax=Ranitomeya imitator TaxID=111125 RepID=A0ABN9LGP1_9NEOB|nr:unnamed protein product [Ranitomeya imitator]